MWFTEFNGDKIGRITPTGSITEFAIPTATGEPEGIAAGPDGAMWFTELGSNKIGRITPTGSITEFPIPTAGSQPGWIAAGPDGAMWFTELGTNKIGRITLTGSITEFPIPAAGSRPEGIVAGPGGAMWFTEGGGNKIGLIGTGPVGVKITRAKITTKLGTATFSFKGIGAATGFRCALVTRPKHHKQPKPHFASCRSPKTYKRLASGRYTFEVSAVSVAGRGTPISRTFAVK